MNQPKTLALLHTSMVFVKVETMMYDLFNEIMPDVKLINIVDDSLLPEVMKLGSIPPAVQQRMNAYVKAAEQTGADAVFSLCSSLGPTIDEARDGVAIPVIKIDDAMALHAAKSATRIGVMATVPTTLGPTCDLIRQKAKQSGKTIEIVPQLVEGAFEKLMAGERDAHDKAVLEAAAELGKNVDTIAFAQASMTRLAPAAEDAAGISVLTSPRIGIEYANQILNGEAALQA